MSVGSQPAKNPEFRVSVHQISPAKRRFKAAQPASGAVVSERLDLPHRAVMDDNAFAELYRKYGSRMYWLCLRMVHNVSDAEDLTQEVFVQVHRKLNTFQGQSAFATWLHRVAVNVVLMHFRRKKGTYVSLDEVFEENGNSETWCGRSAVPVKDDTVLCSSADRMTLQAAIDSLAPGYRICLLLHDVFGYEHREVAAMLGCSDGTSKSQVHKARARIRAWLQAHRYRAS